MGDETYCRVLFNVGTLNFEQDAPVHAPNPKEVAPMSTIEPFHTDSPEYPPNHREVYHDKNTCPDGKKIKDEHRKIGTGNKKHCVECEKVS
jgi:hypothetical protein